MKKIKVFEAFAGYGSQHMALKRLQEEYPDKVEFESVGISEIEKNAITAYNAVHGETKNFGDISQIDWKDVPDFDLFTYSFPCFPAGTKIIGRNGPQNIETFSPGDEVWTHECRWKKIYRTTCRRYTGEKYIIDCMGMGSIVTTDEHPFYVLDTETNSAEPIWVKAKDLCVDKHKLLGPTLYDRVILPDFYREYIYHNKCGKHTYNGHTYHIFDIEHIIHEKTDMNVYNLSVEEDESYTAEGVYVHNCTDISNAGLQAGLSEGSGTRSSLLWECRKAIELKKPKYLLMENVKALAGKKFAEDFGKWRTFLEKLGYRNYWSVLNAKNFGIPQNRERVFMVSILNDVQGFNFPEPFPLKLRLKDVLERSVPEKYYLKQEQVDKIINTYNKPEKHEFEQKNISTNLFDEKPKKPIVDISGPEVIQVGNILDDEEGKFSNPQRGRVYSPEGIAPCQHTCGGGQLEPKIMVPYNLSEDGNAPTITTMYERLGTENLTPGGYGKAMGIMEVIPLNTDIDGNAPTIKANYGKAGVTNIVTDNVEGGERHYNQPGVMEVIPLNTDDEGNSRTIAAHYHKAGGSDFRSIEQGNLAPHTGVMEVISEPTPLNTDKEGNCLAITAHYHKAAGSDFAPRSAGCPLPHTGVIEVEGVSVHPLSRAKEFEGDLNGIKEEVSPCLRATDWKYPHCVWEKDTDKVINVGYVGYDDHSGVHQQDLIQHEEGICRTIPAGTHGSTPHLLKTVVSEEITDDVTFLRGAGGYGDPAEQDIASAVTANCYQENNFIKEQKIMSYSRDSKGKVVDRHLKDIANTVTTYTGGGTSMDQYVTEIDRGGVEYKGEFVKEGDAVDLSRTTPTFGVHVMDGVSPTVRAERADANAVCVKCDRGEKRVRYRIRKLTEREVFRLMDVSDADIDKIRDAGISKTAQYKLAGNSIVVSCLYHIFKKMFIETGGKRRPLF